MKRIRYVPFFNTAAEIKRLFAYVNAPVNNAEKNEVKKSDSEPIQKSLMRYSDETLLSLRNRKKLPGV